MSEENNKVNLSLISHTNVGKTTLARTLLKRDVGDVVDRPHITVENTEYCMMKSEGGFELNLWDTPGFGDSVRLLKELKGVPSPTGWLQDSVWDRIEERTMWCGQEAIRNVSEEADVVLYLVNSAEEPYEAHYIDSEMQILEWLNKPVIVLLNQIGPPRQKSADHTEVRKWEQHVQKYKVVKQVLSMDSFARCWVHEDVLLKCVEGILPFAKRKGFSELLEQWRQQNLKVFEGSMDVISRQLAYGCSIRVRLPKRSLSKNVAKALPFHSEFMKFTDDKREGMKDLAADLERKMIHWLDELVVLHCLDGKAAKKVMKRAARNFSTEEPVNEGISAIIGGFVTGAAGGVTTDVMFAGFSFGSGMVIGGVLGALGVGGLAKSYNFVRGKDGPSVRWSFDFYREFVCLCVLRYMAVAHFGRGRGKYADSEDPACWKEEINQLFKPYEEDFYQIWRMGRKKGIEEKAAREAKPIVTQLTKKLLESLYPNANPF